MAGFFDNLIPSFGGDSTQAPAEAPPAADNGLGLTDAQRQMLGFNTIGNIGALLLAAGQKQMPAQRAQILAQLGNVGGNMMQQANAMQQQQVRQEQLKQLQLNNQNKAALQDYFKSPEVSAAFDNASPAMKTLFEAAKRSGDLGTMTSLVEKTLPKVPNGWGVDYQNGIAYNPLGQAFDLKTMKRVTPNGADTNAGPVDITQFGLPEATRINPDEFQGMDKAYIQRLANVYAGKDTLSGASRGNNAMMQQMQQDVYRLFPNYDPTDAKRRADVITSLSNHKNGALGAYSDSVGTMAEHFNNLADASQDLKNAPIMRFNAAKNQFETETGDPRQTRFATAANIYLSELAKVLKGGGVPTDSDKAEVAATFNRNLADGQLRAGLQTMDQMARARIDATNSTTQRTLGDFYDEGKHSVVTPYAKKQFEQAQNNKWLYPPQNQPQGTAPKVGNYRWTPDKGLVEE